MNNIIFCLNEKRYGGLAETSDKTIDCVVIESDSLSDQSSVVDDKIYEETKKELTEERKILQDRNAICQCGRVLRKGLWNVCRTISMDWWYIGCLLTQSKGCKAAKTVDHGPRG